MKRNRSRRPAGTGHLTTTLVGFRVMPVHDEASGKGLVEFSIKIPDDGEELTFRLPVSQAEAISRMFTYAVLSARFEEAFIRLLRNTGLPEVDMPVMLSTYRDQLQRIADEEYAGDPDR